MLARCRAVSYGFAFLAILLFALLTLGGHDLEILHTPVAPYALLWLSALALLAGEAMHVMGGPQAGDRIARSRKARPAPRPATAGAETREPAASVDDLVGMLGDTLKLARPLPDIAQREPVDVARVLAALAERKGCARLALDDRPRPLHTLASPPAITRAFEILVENALSSGSRAAVSFDCGTSALVVHLDDDGPGVPRGERAHVFEWRYYMSTPPSRQAGCRAELVIARQIIRAHGGDIVVGSSPLGGARFSARLPLLGEHESELAAAS